RHPGQLRGQCLTPTLAGFTRPTTATRGCARPFGGHAGQLRGHCLRPTLAGCTRPTTATRGCTRPTAATWGCARPFGGRVGRVQPAGGATALRTGRPTLPRPSSLPCPPSR